MLVAISIDIGAGSDSDVGVRVDNGVGFDSVADADLDDDIGFDNRVDIDDVSIIISKLTSISKTISISIL